MASQIMEKILETEAKCEELVKAAKSDALETASSADMQAQKILQSAKVRAKELASEKAAEARKQAEKIAAEGAEKARIEIEALQNSTRDKFDLASKAVASMLLKIS